MEADFDRTQDAEVGSHFDLAVVWVGNLIDYFRAIVGLGPAVVTVNLDFAEVDPEVVQVEGKDFALEVAVVEENFVEHIVVDLEEAVVAADFETVELEDFDTFHFAVKATTVVDTVQESSHKSALCLGLAYNKD